jgi:hypothetical protein
MGNMQRQQLFEHDQQRRGPIYFLRHTDTIVATLKTPY